jgi:hypothetical protein
MMLPFVASLPAPVGYIHAETEKAFFIAKDDEMPADVKYRFHRNCLI